MKGDFTRDTFLAVNHFSQVLQQQGRAQLDADFNEQISILLHYLRSLTVDLIGPYAGPQSGGFEINKIQIDNNRDFVIKRGHYYVDGLLCENEDDVYYTQQKPDLEDIDFSNKQYLVYLDVWERYITSLQDDRIREKALNGLDTAARAKIVWQVKVHDLSDQGVIGDLGSNHDTWLKMIDRLWQPDKRGQIQARCQITQGAYDKGDCLSVPNVGYHGLENQLYRVEIHNGGLPAQATYKWSRDNGSVTFPISAISGKIITLDRGSLSGRFSLEPGQWVEIVTDQTELLQKPGILLCIDIVDVSEDKVTVRANERDVPNISDNDHSLLRRWDHATIANLPEGIPISEGRWQDLEQGIQINFEKGADRYRSGDYWLIPARVATGDIEWLEKDGLPLAMQPHGIDHHYAPLALIGPTFQTYRKPIVVKPVKVDKSK